MLLILAVAAALSGPAPVGTEAAHPALPGRTGQFTADSLDVELYARVLQSADQRRLDTTLIATALRSHDPEIRSLGARTLSQVALRHREQAIPLMRALTADTDSAVASAAMFGLGLVHDTASVPLLADSFRAAEASAPAAAWALGEMGATGGAAIARLLRESAAARVTRPASRAAVTALLVAASRSRPLPFATLAPYLVDSDPQLRWAAAYAIARQHSPAGARALLEAASPDAAFRAEVARELTLKVAGDSLRGRALARLRELAADPDPHVRINAIRSIGTFGPVARSTVLRALNDRDPNVRVAAAQSATAALGTSRALWNRAWRTDTIFKVRQSLLESAMAAGIVLPGAAAWQTSPDWRRRHAAVSAWAASHDTARMRSVALAMTHDSDARVRGAALGTLVASDTARRDSLVRRALAAASTDPDSIVRLAAAPSAANPDTTPVVRPLSWYEAAVRRVVLPSLRGHPPRATMVTARGTLVITFEGVLAPLTVLNYATLAERHVYDNLQFHRVVPAFVAQDGDPRGDGEGGPGYTIRDELTLLPYTRGAVGMALSGPDTGGSQYFLTLTPQPHLTGHYTLFGHVTSGLNVMDALVEGDAIRSVVIDW